MRPATREDLIVEVTELKDQISCLQDWVQEAVNYGVNYDLTEEAWELFGIRKQETSAV